MLYILYIQWCVCGCGLDWKSRCAHVVQKGSGSAGCVAQVISPDQKISSRLKFVALFLNFVTNSKQMHWKSCSDTPYIQCIMKCIKMLTHTPAHCCLLAATTLVSIYMSVCVYIVMLMQCNILLH